jgi:hypothetical protein
MATTQETQNLVNQKLAAFEQLQPEFETSFHFVQDMHGQRRFQSISIADIVHYLHALWICECKDRLLSVYKNITRYEGHHCLVLLRGWQQGENADVVDFLQRKLDTMPFADLTRQIQHARQLGGEEGLAQRLLHGRLILLSRGMNLIHTLDAIFSLADNELLREVQKACTQYGHQPDQIEKQLAAMESPLYAYIPYQALAQRNIAVMNKLGVDVTKMPPDRPGNRSWRVLEPTEPMQPFAEHLIEGYLELTLPDHNNIRGLRFSDRRERSNVEEV